MRKQSVKDEWEYPTKLGRHFLIKVAGNSFQYFLRLKFDGLS